MVAQVAITPVVRLPDGCQVADQSKRSITRTQLSTAFEGTSTTWSDIFGTAITAISGSGETNASCQSTAFVRVVRLDSSGTTFLFNRYLNQASHSTGGDGFDWRDPGDGGTLANAWLLVVQWREQKRAGTLAWTAVRVIAFAYLLAVAFGYNLLSLSGHY